jgi:hypothetical protein
VFLSQPSQQQNVEVGKKGKLDFLVKTANSLVESRLFVEYGF